jgi:hypothetical protein
VGAELFHADGQTDGRTDRRTDRHDEANSRFSQFCECSQKGFPLRPVGTAITALKRISNHAFEICYYVLKNVYNMLV